MSSSWKRFFGLSRDAFRSDSGSMLSQRLCRGSRRKSFGAPLLPVERLEDRNLLTTFTVTTPADSGEGSLRAAITQANLDATLDTIEFDIVNLSGSFIKRISLQSDLPVVDTPIHFDGTTMPTFAGAPLVVLDGSAVETGIETGLFFASGSEGSVVEALTINGFAAYGIRISADNVTVRGSYIGTNETGTGAQANGTGIGITGSNFTIGGTTAAERNIISGNASDGIELLGGSNGVVRGNYIGIDVTGSIAIPNIKGISNYNGSHGNLIGGTIAGSGNVISGNHIGVDLFGTGFGATVQGNLIGLTADGEDPLPNTSNGIQIVSSDNLIGGPSAAAANTIAFNEDAGIFVGAGTGNRFQRNSIYLNEGLGIDLDGDGVTDNDGDDSDSGPNNLLNYPSITSATRIGGNVQIIGVYDGPANETLTLEFFSNIYEGSSTFGQGAFYLGETSVTTNGSGHATFNVTLAIADGSLITATASDSSHNTSEFSAQVMAPDTTITLQETALPVQHHKTILVDPQATVATTRANFNGTALRIAVAAGAHELDTFKIANFKDSVSGARVKFVAKKQQLRLGRTVIANTNTEGSAQEIVFTGELSSSLLQQIVRHITFRSSQETGDRVISIQSRTSDHAPLSAISTRTIHVT